MEIEEHHRQDRSGRGILRIVGGLFVFSPSSLSFLDASLVSVGILSIFTKTFWNTLLTHLTSAKFVALYIFAFLALLHHVFKPESSDTQFLLATFYLFGVFVLFLVYRNHRNVILEGYAIGATLTSFLGIGFYFVYLFVDTQRFESLINNNGRLDMFFSDPNVFGAFLVPALLVITLHLLANKKRKMLLLLSGICIFSALILTFSRGALINLIAAYAIFLFLIDTGKVSPTTKKAPTKACLLLFIVLIIAIVGITFFPSEGSRTKSSDTPRLENIQYAVNEFTNRNARFQLFGSGSGSYEVSSPEHISAHNTYARFLIEYGVLGTSLIMLFFVWHIAVRFKQYLNKSYFYFPVVLASISGIAIQALVIDTFHWRHFWLLLGIL